MAKKSAKMREIEKKPKFGKDDLVREISRKGNFNLGDSRLFVNILTEILEESVAQERHFSVASLFTLVYGGLPERESTNPYTQERTLLPAATRLTVRLGKNIRNLVK